ncbi:50S ribosomal protein L15 [Maritalea mediterranea]|uniref:Large ribosomal subunit protein uL15 n=1 Tax=Maritalea mediterranea TaxID=2909667 RepID=A0ABS9E8X9_9HYPH|nr:50S ribosomal protein L15 [Maritalea mediterranea]MCF4098662.1 50S ribosomal protein L15 [Maritalea mediterranea]
MRLNELADNKGATKNRTRIGRGIGSGKGKTGGRGVKGQKSRSGVSVNGFRGEQTNLIQQMPKRGFNNPFAKKFNAVRLDRIQSAIDSGKLDAKGVIDAKALVEAGVIRRAKDGVRLIAGGEFKASKVTFKVDHASKGAQAAVEAAGGKIDLPAAAE